MQTGQKHQEEKTNQSLNKTCKREKEKELASPTMWSE